MHGTRAVRKVGFHRCGDRLTALYSFATTDNYRDGCLAAVSLGDDADTTAAVYGQIADAYYDDTHVPSDWRNNLALSDVIQRLWRSLTDS